MNRELSLVAVLRPQSFALLVRRLMEEPRRQDACFDLPRRKWWIPPDETALDLSADFHGLRAGTPFGPAAGPHAQMAQNVLLSWLAGSRIIELKTIQILDELDIPRPCIDIRNIGFNIEWSQELKLEESAREYAAGAMLIAIARAENLLGLQGDAAARPDPVVFDLSVGYDLKGVQSPRVVSTIRSLMDARPLFNMLRCEIPEEYGHLRSVEVDPVLVRTATISTFHGCPPEEIEGIATFLMEEFGLHTIVKLNPTLLGHNRVDHLLHETLGYETIRIPESAFANDLTWNDSMDLARRLESTAHRCGIGLGFKFTNTLVVENDEGPFSRKEKTRYLSGAPLHVITLTLADEWRRAADFHGALSFSAGIDKHNAPDAVACGFVPVTTCTDLLKLGGYGRLPEYHAALIERMRLCEAIDRNEYLLRAEGFAGQAAGEIARDYADFARNGKGPLSRPIPKENLSPTTDRARLCRRNLQRLDPLLDPKDRPAVLRAVFGDGEGRGWDDLLPEDLPLAETFYEDVVRRASMLNHRAIAQRTRNDPRYRQEKNTAVPKKIKSHLSVFDCINCDKCIPACPNDAIFFYEIGHREAPPSEISTFPEKKHQLAILADWCNECGNCETYCPEQGAPFIEKPNFYISLHDLQSDRRNNGYAFEPADGPGRGDKLHAWIDDTEYSLEHVPGAPHALLRIDHLTIRFTWPEGKVSPGQSSGESVESGSRHVEVFHRLRFLLEGVARGSRVNTITTSRQIPLAKS